MIIIFEEFYLSNISIGLVVVSFFDTQYCLSSTSRICISRQTTRAAVSFIFNFVIMYLSF